MNVLTRGIHARLRSVLLSVSYSTLLTFGHRNGLLDDDL